MLRILPSPEVVGKVMNDLDFQLPELFENKIDGMRFLQDNGLWVLFPVMAARSIVEGMPEELHRPELLGLLTKNFGDLRSSSIFAEELTVVLTELDMKKSNKLESLSRYTLSELEWLCEDKSNGQMGCLWGILKVYKFDESGAQRAKLMEEILRENLVQKEIFVEWYKLRERMRDILPIPLQEFFRSFIL
ncbi:unnamed protein product [Choristocarpus tenellus]